MIRKSFKQQIFLAILAVSLLPLLISGVFLVQLMRLRVANDYEQRLLQQASQVDAAVEEVLSQLQETTNQIARNQEAVFKFDRNDRWIQNQAYEKLYEITNAKRSLARFEIYDVFGQCMYSTGAGKQDKYLPTYWGILNAAREQDGKLIFQKSQEVAEEDVLLYGARTVNDDRGNRRGYIVLSLTEDHFSETLKKVPGIQEGIAFLDPGWNCIYSVGTAKEENIAGILREQLLHGEKLPELYNGNEVLISSIGSTAFYKVMLRPQAFSDTVVSHMYGTILIIGIISFLICSLVAMRISKGLFAPILKITGAMHEMQEGNLDVRVPSGREDELGQMSDNFNMMAAELQDYMERQVRAQQELDDSHVAMMQAQLNPHFLYNTLDTMKWLAKANHVPEIATMSTSLAKILRTSISGNQFISLKEELELVTSYVEIQKIRFNDAFRLQVEASEALQEAIVPKLIVQPIVENAILHGLEEVENGKICISVASRGEVLQITVRDNGKGMDEAVLQDLNSHDRDRLTGHIGFYNVDTILRLHYGEPYGLIAECPKEGGTIVTITMPLQLKE